MIPVATGGDRWRPVATNLGYPERTPQILKRFCVLGTNNEVYTIYWYKKPEL
jgi:hypothetical protein